MIVTILPGSADFHAVGYNEQKVKQGDARLLEIKNFGAIGMFGTYDTNDLVSYLKLYSSQNDRIRKPQFHVAISCRGHEMTEQQLLDFAHEYLKEMGYADEGQPLLVYSHHDTANTHIHIITSRVNPQGKKIDHNHERRRSQKVIDKLLGNDINEETTKAIDIAKCYAFGKPTQFMAVLHTLGYESYITDEVLHVKKSGIVQRRIQLSELESLCKQNIADKKYERKLKQVFLKYRDLSNSRKELTEALKKKFGIDLVFYGKADTPYGYAIVDHRNKTVIPGNRILKIKSLLDFTSPEEKMNRIDSFIDSLLEENPKITVFQINEKLRSSKAFIRKGKLHLGNHEKSLAEVIANAIDRNDRIHFVEQCKPTDIGARDILCRLCKIDDEFRHMVEISNESESANKSDLHRREIIEELRQLFSTLAGSQLRMAIRGKGLLLRSYQGQVYAICMQRSNRSIINLTEAGLEIERLWPDKELLKMLGRKAEEEDKKHNSSRHRKPGRPNILTGKTSDASGQNREWEVGSKNNETVDDRIKSDLSY